MTSIGDTWGDSIGNVVRTGVKKYGRQDQRLLAAYAADCAERALPFFETAYPADDRPRKAIEACRVWIRTGIFRMVDIRGASLAAHAAARNVQSNEAACFAARAAGQAVAAAHVPQHAFGAAYYALKAAAAANAADDETKIVKERNRQSRRLPEDLRQEVTKRIAIHHKGDRIVVKLQKRDDF